MNQPKTAIKRSIAGLMKVLCLAATILSLSSFSLAENQGTEGGAKTGKARVLFMVAEQNIGREFYSFWWWGQPDFHGQTMDMSAAETQLKESFLNAGFEVVDISATTGTFEVSNAYRVADLTDKGAREIAKKVNAEIVVKGKALAKEGPRTPGSAVGSYLADVTATAIRVDNGKVLGAAKGHGVSRHVSDVTGGTEALSRAATELADRLMEQINAKWPGMNEAKASPEPPSIKREEPMSPAISSDVDTLPTAVAKPKKNAYAVVIGIEQYREKLPKADFAVRDANIMGEYLTKVLGFPEANVVVRLNEKAAKTDLEKYFEEWLPRNVEAGGSVFVYYSGHGAPNAKTGEAYLVPYDGDPTFIDSTGYPIKRLYAALQKLPATEIVVVLDSCFSGAGGRSVIAKGSRPMVIAVENPVLSGGNTVVLAASSSDQISSTYEEQGHGLLTYFFLKGLQGGGDLNKDGAIKMTELFDYVKDNVQRVARKQYNSEQTPQLLASPELRHKSGGKLLELR